jgi:hypothetical protein
MHTTDTSQVERAAFFQEALRQNGSQPLEIDVIQKLIHT